MFTKENQQIPNIKWKKKKKNKRSRSRSDQIRSRSSSLDRDRCDGCSAGVCCGFGVSREIGERESEVARGWLGTSWAREKARWLGVLGVAGGGSVARDSEEKRAQWERERAETESRLKRETHACFGKWFTEKFSVNHFPYFTLRFSCQFPWIFRWLRFYSIRIVQKCWKRFP